MVVLGGACFLQFLLSTVCVNHFQKRFFFLSTFVWYRCCDAVFETKDNCLPEG